MNKTICKFPQTRFWYEILEHLSALPGAAVTNPADNSVTGSWIDFTYREHTFPINSESGEFMFLVMGKGCHSAVRIEILVHFEAFMGNQTDYGGGRDITLRRV